MRNNVNKQPFISAGSFNTPPERLLAIDPGIHNGWAIFKNGIIEDLGTIDGIHEFDEWLHKQENIDLVVLEDFVLFRHKAQVQIGSKFEVTQVIGMVKSWARRNKIPVVMQKSDVLPIAGTWSKMPMPKDHSKSHHVAAYNHGFYYLVNNNMRAPEGM